MKRTALITGIAGQDGSFLAELLLNKGYRVVGMVRRSSVVTYPRIDHLTGDNAQESEFKLEYGDMSDGSSLRRIISQYEPDEIYNLAAQTHVGVSFHQPEYTNEVTGMGVLRLLEALRDYFAKTGHEVRLFQASSSEIFGRSPTPHDEGTRFQPCNPYGVAKLTGFWHTVNYRETYGLFCANGIMFNHESERRSEAFVSRKITRAVGRIKLGLQSELLLGNLDAKRDWGYSPEFVEAMWLMLQTQQASDFVIATGESRSVREFLSEAFARVGLDWQRYVKIDPLFSRPAEIHDSLGNSAKARCEIGWKPKVTFSRLIEIMVAHDLELAEREVFALKYSKKKSPSMPYQRS